MVLCISRDLPFAQARFCGAEGIENVVMLSDFATGSFGKKYQLEMTNGPFGKFALESFLLSPTQKEDQFIQNKYRKLLKNQIMTLH